MIKPMVLVLKINHTTKILMQLYASKNINFVHIITFFNSLLKKLQKIFTLKKYISFEIGLKCIISEYNQGYIIQELCTWFVE